MSGAGAHGKSRIYVCHTFYHVYIACLKELYLLHGADLSREKASAGSGGIGRAHLCLSTMSNDFSGMAERASRCPLFEKVFLFDEKRESFFPELQALKEDTGSLIKNLRNRIRLCRRFPALLEPFVPADFRAYDDIYVFCDIDPVGVYLNGKRIHYHAVEDGLNCLAHYNPAVAGNRRFFGLKKLLAARGLIHMPDGYARYCIDMEVNDLSLIRVTNKKMKELPRKKLTEALTRTDRELLLDLFVKEPQKLRTQLAQSKDKPCVLILSEPLCTDLKVRERLFLDLIETYGGEDCTVLFKQHPRDDLDYTDILPPRVILLDKGFPMEMLYFMEGLRMDRVVSVYTVLDAFPDVKEKIRLGDAFMDRYEDPAKHWLDRDGIPAPDLQTEAGTL